MKKLVFYKCRHCGNVVVKLVDKMTPIFCCGEEMQILEPNTHEGAGEKHVPVVEVSQNLVKVSVGEVLHPMSEEHFIQFVAVKTNNGLYVKHFEPTDKPVCEFALLPNEKVEKTYAYCNLHSLWAK